MIQNLRHHLVGRLGTNTKHLDLVLSSFRPLRVKRNSWLLREGEKCCFVYFLVEGSLQIYSLSPQDSESTRDIVLPGSWCSELTSFHGDGLSRENIRTIEDSALLSIHKSDFDRMTNEVPQFRETYRQILQTNYEKSVVRINTLIAMNASQRIEWMMQNRPELADLVTSKVIASYLGITQETYSRLKSRSSKNH